MKVEPSNTRKLCSYGTVEPQVSIFPFEKICEELGVTEETYNNTMGQVGSQEGLRKILQMWEKIIED